MPFTNPKKNIEKFQILPGACVVDLGCGSGEYSLLAALLAGEKGRLYAIDVQKDVLTSLKRRAQEKRIFNIEVIWGDVEKLGGTHLVDDSVDVAIASNIFFQIEDKESFVQETKRILKTGKGKVYLIDWLDSFGNLGPEKSHVVSPEVAKEIFSRNGFVPERVLSDVGEHHYGLVFRKL